MGLLFLASNPTMFLRDRLNYDTSPTQAPGSSDIKGLVKACDVDLGGKVLETETVLEALPYGTIRHDKDHQPYTGMYLLL